MSSIKSKQRVFVKIQLRLEGGLKVIKANDYLIDMSIGSEIFTALEKALSDVKRKLQNKKE